MSEKWWEVTGFLDLTAEKYRAHPAIAQSDLKRWADPDFKGIGKRALLHHSAFHCGILEQKEFFNRYFWTKAEFNLTTTDGKEQRKLLREHNGGREPLRPKERAQLESWAETLRANPEFCKIFYELEGPKEQAIVTKLDGTDLLSKCLIDKITPKALVDLKLTHCRNPKEFQDSIVKYGYDIQGAYYQDCWHAETGEYKKIVWACVNDDGHGSWLIQATPYQLACGRRWYQDMLRIMERTPEEERKSA